MGATYDEIKQYVGFDDDDRARLALLWPVVEPHVPSIVDHFYERALAFESTRAVLRDEAQVERLKCTLGRWLEELLRGPHDAEYAERRRRIGHRHVEVGLESRFMHAALQVVADDLARVLSRSLPLEQLPPALASLQRALSIDLTLMTGTYIEGREARSWSALQEVLVWHLRVTVALVDRHGVITAATRPTGQLFGGEEAIGRVWTEVVPAPLLAAAQLEAQVERALRTGREIGLPRVDLDDQGQTRSFRIHIVPLSHPLARFVLQIEELTDVVALEGRLRRSEALAHLGALSAAVAHELRNPLAGISGAIQVIGRSIPADAPYAGIMGKLEGEIRRLDTLVTDLLAFARQGAVRLGPVDLERPCRIAIELVRADHPGVRFELVGHGQAQADENLVQQIVLNLLHNAGQALDGRGGRVTVTLADGRIAVADDGPGVPAQVAERIFQPFYTTKVRGTGLGLAICQRTAHAMNGQLHLLPPGPTPGATFVLELAPPMEGVARDLHIPDSEDR